MSTVRLPRPVEYRILMGAAGDLVLRPWFDAVSLRALTRWHLPLSRAWAAALESAGDPEALLATLGIEGPRAARSVPLAARLVSVVRERGGEYARAVAAWEAALFAPGAGAEDDLIAAELARQQAAERLMAARWAGLPLRLRHRLPAARWEIPRPEQIAPRQVRRLAEPGERFPAPALPEVQRSRVLPGGYGREYWLRFAAPVIGDTAWARVYEPEGVAAPPTLIYLHGICMETEMWRPLADVVSRLALRGVRVIRPEGPWHGRRRISGWYGGEPTIGRGVPGMIEMFDAWVAEVAVLIDWARRTGGPVALGGVSLGALTSQLAATAARDWPAHLCPDALLLVATGGDMLAASEEGSLTRALGLPQRLRRSGWSPEVLRRWLPLLQPEGDPAVPPERVVMLLGRRDDLVPYGTGLALARRWRVPAENLFVREQGHFSVSLGLGQDTEPFERVIALLDTRATRHRERAAAPRTRGLRSARRRL